MSVNIDIEYPGSCLSGLSGLINGEEKVTLPSYRDLKELEEWLRLGGAKIEREMAQDQDGWLVLKLNITW